MKSHDTFVLGIKDGRVAFIRSFDYKNETDQAQETLKFVRNKNNFDGYFISHVGEWIMEHKNNDGVRYPISVPMI